jgi:hypothetical protein
MVVCLMTGCYNPRTDMGQYRFYYLRNDYLTAENMEVLAFEKRSADTDMRSLLDTYLSGPKSEELSSPFPADTYIVSLEIEGDYLNIAFSDHFASLTGIQLTLACCALSQTCFAVSDVKTVVIRAQNALLDGKESIAIPRGSFILTDNSHIGKEKA